MGNPKSPNSSIGETASDKRKSGNEIEEIDSKESQLNSGMAKETRQVLKFTDIAGILSFYENRMSFMILRHSI